jgi:hypothetical protein
MNEENIKGTKEVEAVSAVNSDEKHSLPEAKTNVEDKSKMESVSSEPEKKKVAPKIFFKQDSKVEISINGYHNNDTGELAFAIPADDKDTNDDSFGELFTKVNYKFWFSRCPYDKYNRYRTRSMIYNSEDQNNTINELRLREFFLVFHLVDWNLTDEDGNKVELKFDPNKALSDESLKLIYTLPNTLLDVVLTTYEKKMSL